MKIANFDPRWGALVGGATGTISESSVDDNASLVLHLTNQSGAARSAGDVVVIDTSTNEAFTTSTTSNTVTPIGVVDEAIAVGSNGRVVVGGYAAAVSTLGTSLRGDYLYHSSTAATAAHMFGTSPAPGAFGYVLAGGSNANTTAHIFPPYASSTISAASNTTDVGSSVVVGATGKYSDGAHVHRGVSSISHASNTFYGGVTLTTPGNTVGITKPSEGTLALTSVGGTGGGSSTPPEGYEAYCSADTTLTNANTWYDITGMSLSLPAGTYDLYAYIYGDDANAGATSIEIGIHNGTTQISSTATSKTTGAGQRFQVSIGHRLTLAGTTTVKVQASSTRGTSSTVIRTTASFGTGGVANTACRLRAIKVQTAP